MIRIAWSNSALLSFSLPARPAQLRDLGLSPEEDGVGTQLRL